MRCAITLHYKNADNKNTEILKYSSRETFLWQADRAHIKDEGAKMTDDKHIFVIFKQPVTYYRGR